MDKAQAIEKAKARGCKDLTPDTGLYGQKRSFYTEKKMDAPEIPANRFQYGKYIGQLIATNTDIEYLNWYYNDIPNGSHDKIVAKRICELNPEMVIYKGKLMHKDTRKRAKIIARMREGKIDLISVSNFKLISHESDDQQRFSIKVFPSDMGKEFDLIEPYHPYGVEIEIVDTLNLVERQYNGYSYFVPKGSRSFKNTTFRIENEKIILK